MSLINSNPIKFDFSTLTGIVTDLMTKICN